MEATQKKSALSVNMAEGSLWKNMLLFSLPLMLTQVLEVLFNLSDVAIAGKFADYRALGAVGSTTLLVSLFTGLLIGMGSGVNVAVARGLGMGDRQRVEKTVHTSFVLCAAIGVVLCLICVLLARPMLALLHTKDELMDGAVLYLKIYALSMPAMAVYNCGNGIMSAVGDTRRPLLYLSVAGVLNVVLNLFFVLRCHMAAEGVAMWQRHRPVPVGPADRAAPAAAEGRLPPGAAPPPGPSPGGPAGPGHRHPHGAAERHFRRGQPVCPGGPELLRRRHGVRQLRRRQRRYPAL